MWWSDALSGQGSGANGQLASGRRSRPGVRGHLCEGRPPDGSVSWRDTAAVLPTSVRGDYKGRMPAVDTADLRVAVTYTATVLAPYAATDDWDRPAGSLAWSCRQTLAHAVDACNWYAGLLARAGDGDLTVAEVSQAVPPGALLDCLVSAGTVLSAVVSAAGSSDRGYHEMGSPDRTGYAAMGADEVLVHGWDIASGFGVEFEPPEAVCTAVVQRLFPWTPAELVADDPWRALLWANGRTALADRPLLTAWGWWCRPLDEWDGRTMPTWT